MRVNIEEQTRPSAAEASGTTATAAQSSVTAVFVGPASAPHNASYTPEDYGILIKRALMYKREAFNHDLKHLYDEIAADLPTFYKTGHVPNPVNIGESVGAGGVIAYFGAKAFTQKRAFTNLLKVWHRYENNLQKGQLPTEDDLKSLLATLRNNGVTLKDLEEHDDVENFKASQFRALHKRYTTSLKEKANRYYKAGPDARARLKRHKRPARAKRMEKARDFAAHFWKGLGENIKNPMGFGTPRAVIGGIWSSFKLGVYGVRHAARKMDPRNIRLYFLKKDYKSAPVMLPHWENAVSGAGKMRWTFLNAAATSASLGCATAFMALHGHEGLSHNVQEAYHGNPLPIIVNVFSAVAAAGPLKNLGVELQKLETKVREQRLQLKKDYTAVQRDAAVILENHKAAPQEGFQVIALEFSKN